MGSNFRIMTRYQFWDLLCKIMNSQEILKLSISTYCCPKYLLWVIDNLTYSAVLNAGIKYWRNEWHKWVVINDTLLSCSPSQTPGYTTGFFNNLQFPLRFYKFIFRACLKRRYVYEASRPMGRTAKIYSAEIFNFGRKSPKRIKNYFYGIVNRLLFIYFIVNQDMINRNRGMHT